MPVKTKIVLDEHLRNVPLPTHGKTYAVVSHGAIIDLVVNELYTAGFIVKEAQYKCSLDGQIAQGTYHLEFTEDPDLGLSFAWINSYNKQRAFKCATGGHVFACMNGVVSGEIGVATRRHSGSALSDVKEYIKDQISLAKVHYRMLCRDKNILKNITLTPADKGKILGQLFAEHEILTLTQVGIVKREMDKPSYQYSTNPNSAWDMYNHITVALKDSHPQSYIEDHQRLHEFFMNQYGSPKTTVTTQLDLEFDNTVKEEYETTAEELQETTGNYGVVFL